MRTYILPLKLVNLFIRKQLHRKKKKSLRITLLARNSLKEALSTLYPNCNLQLTIYYNWSSSFQVYFLPNFLLRLLTPTMNYLNCIRLKHKLRKWVYFSYFFLILWAYQNDVIFACDFFQESWDVNRLVSVYHRLLIINILIFITWPTRCLISMNFSHKTLVAYSRKAKI